MAYKKKIVTGGILKKVLLNDTSTAFRIEAKVEHLKACAVPRQQPPPTLADAAKKQSVFELKKVAGTFVGFHTSDFMQSLNVPGYHLHFLAADRQDGSHVLDCVIRRAEVRIAETTQFYRCHSEFRALKRRNVISRRPSSLDSRLHHETFGQLHVEFSGKFI